MASATLFLLVALPLLVLAADEKPKGPKVTDKVKFSYSTHFILHVSLSVKTSFEVLFK
jgi:hypothetical protein